MSDKEIKNVFVSHFHEDEDSIKQMKDLLGEDYSIRNYSVTSDKYNNAKDDDYIKSLLRPLINEASTVFCLIGPNTHDSEWVDWELQTAHKMGKQIIGVFLRGAKDSDVPDALNKYADSIVGWNKENIEKAINGEPTFVDASSTTRPYGGTDRTQC